MANPRPPSIHRSITSRKLKSAVFALEGLNSLSTTYFFYDIYFYTQAKFHFGAIKNLLLAALIGASYAVAAFLGGRFAQRAGYFTSVKWGSGIMAVIFLAGTFFDSWPATLAVILIGNVGLCLTWPALQGMVSEGEPAVRLQSLLGIYNVTWSSAGAMAYFTGGWLQQTFGMKSIFFVPSAILFFQVGLTAWIERQAEKELRIEVDPPLLASSSEGYSSPVPPAVFLKMGWLANPFAYIAINTVISTIPTLARQFRLSLMAAGFICSIWLFTRSLTFVGLRLWPKWHYRFRFLAASYVAMIASFAGMLLASNLALFILSQIIFGLAIGLIYYSSLFYSMDVGETKGEHGGIHEAVIGAGNAGGPALAAAALIFFPESTGSGAAAVCGLLLCGLGGLYWLRYRGAR